MPKCWNEIRQIQPVTVQAANYHFRVAAESENRLHLAASTLVPACLCHRHSLHQNLNSPENNNQLLLIKYYCNSMQSLLKTDSCLSSTLLSVWHCETYYRIPHGVTYTLRMPVLSRGGSKGWPRGGTRPLWELRPPNETGCKVAGLHNSCIYSVALHRWCQITPLSQSCIMSSEILAPPPNTDVATPLATPDCCS